MVMSDPSIFLKKKGRVLNLKIFYNTVVPKRFELTCTTYVRAYVHMSEDFLLLGVLVFFVKY